MTASTASHTCCLGCRLRFAAADAAYLIACPTCGEPVQTRAGLSGAIGFRLFRPEDVPASLPEALAVSLPHPDPSSWRP